MQNPKINNIFPLTSLHAHGSTIVQLADNSFRAAWFYGSGEDEANDVLIQYSTLPDSFSTQWSTPETIADSLGFPDCNPALFSQSPGSDETYLVWMMIQQNDWSGAMVKYKKFILNPKTSQLNQVKNDVIAINMTDKFPQTMKDKIPEVQVFCGNIEELKNSILVKSISKLTANIDIKPTFEKGINRFLKSNPKFQGQVFDGEAIQGILNALTDFVRGNNPSVLNKISQFIHSPKPLNENEILATLIALLLNIYAEILFILGSEKVRRIIGWETRIKSHVLSNGRLLLPLYSDFYNVSLVLISDDNGETWTPSSPIVGLANIQPAIVEKNDGTLVAYMRNNGWALNGFHPLISTSIDKGETWTVTQQEKAFYNNTSSLDIVRLKNNKDYSGAWIMATNDNLKDERNKMVLAISQDEGKSWEKRDLEFSQDENETFSYPAIIEDNQGMVHLTYSYTDKSSGSDLDSIRYAMLDPAWITASD